MRIKAKSHVKEIAGQNKLSTEQIFLSSDKEYVVFASVLFEGITLLQIIDDIGYPAWYPANLFEVVDTYIPSDWIFNIIEGESIYIIGPSYIAKNLTSYEAMVNLEPEAVKMFWTYVESLADRSIY